MPTPRQGILDVTLGQPAPITVTNSELEVVAVVETPAPIVLQTGAGVLPSPPGPAGPIGPPSISRCPPQPVPAIGQSVTVQWDNVTWMMLGLSGAAGDSSTGELAGYFTITAIDPVSSIATIQRTS